MKYSTTANSKTLVFVAVTLLHCVTFSSAARPSLIRVDSRAVDKSQLDLEGKPLPQGRLEKSSDSGNLSREDAFSAFRLLFAFSDDLPTSMSGWSMSGWSMSGCSMPVHIRCPQNDNEDTSIPIVDRHTASPALPVEDSNATASTKENDSDLYLPTTISPSETNSSVESPSLSPTSMGGEETAAEGQLTRSGSSMMQYAWSVMTTSILLTTLLMISATNAVTK